MKTNIKLSAPPIRFEQISPVKWRVIPNIPGVIVGYIVLEMGDWRFEPNEAAQEWCSLRASQMQQIADKMKDLETPIKQ